MKRRWIWIAAMTVMGAVALLAVRLYIRESTREMRSQLFIPKQARITPQIELLQQYVRIDTSNPPGKELAGARFLARLLEANGVKAEIIESAPGRGNIYARIKGRRSGEGLLLMNHIDVVPATNAGWKHPPFDAAIALNQLWGRGTLDMKGIAICELQAFLDVARSGRQPERDLVFLGVADEERGGTMGTKWLLQHRPDIFEGVRYALNEGGVTETRAEGINYFGIEIGTKMTARVRLRAPSRESMQRARIALEPYFGPPDPDRILPEVTTFFHQVAPHRIEQREVLKDLPATMAAGKFWLLARGFKELTQNVLWATGVSGDAHGATMDVNFFDLPDEDPNRRIAWLKSTVAPYGVTVQEVLERNGPAPLSSPNTPLYALLRRSIERQYGAVPVGVQILANSSNDSRFLRARGILCYGIWPFPVDYYQSLGIHNVDERVRLDWFMQGVELMRGLVHQYANGA